jgi:hypothetical protein
MRGIRRRGGVGSIVLVVGVAVASVLGGSAAAGVEAKASKKDKAILAAAVIQDADVPSAWASSQSSNTAGNDVPADAACRSIKAATNAARHVPNAMSRQYMDPNAPSLADDQVFAFPNVKNARAYLADYKASDTSSCLQEIFGRPFGPGGGQVQGTPVVSPITDLQPKGDERIGYEVVVPLTSQGQSFDLHWDLIYMRLGRGVVHFVFNNAGQRNPQLVSIVSAVVSRMGHVNVR